MSDIISAIEDKIDELEDLAYNRADSYRINQKRDEISLILNQVKRVIEEKEVDFGGGR
jgi:hypothetical protein